MEKTGEVWKEVPDWGDYEISNLGRMKSFRKDTPAILKGSTNDDGFKYISISYKGDGVNLKLSTSRLVAALFIKKEDETYNHVIHLDGNVSNNHYKNLQWTNRSGWLKNQYVKDKTYGKGERGPNKKLTTEQVQEIRTRYKRLGYKESNCLDLAKEFNVKRGAIQRVVKETTWIKIK